MHNNIMLLLFSVAGGLALSGIASNLYRLLTKKGEHKGFLYYGVMVVAGPNVLFENATASYRAKKCTRLAYGFAVAIIGYWAFALGLLTISVATAL